MIKRKTSLWAALLLGVCVGVCSPDVAASQPGDDGAKPQETERPESQRREIAKRMVEARLERLRAEQASLEATLAAIEAGQPLDQLRIPDGRWQNDRADRDDRRDRGRADGQDPDGDRSQEEFTDAQVLAFIAEVYPEWMPRIEQLRERDPEALRRMIGERRPRLIELMVERRENPEIFEVRRRIARSEMSLRRAAWAFARASSDAERQEAEAELEAVLSDQFDLRIELQRAELQNIEEQASSKQEELEAAITNREQLIAERKADLLRAIEDRRPPFPGRDAAGRPGRPGDRDRPRPDGPLRR